MRAFLFALVVLLAGVALTGCESSDEADRQDRRMIDRQQEIYDKALPIPLFDYSQTRDSLIQIYRAKVSSVATYSVVTSMTGQVIFQCPSIGFPIPADTQLTNPLKPIWSRSSGSPVIEQAEPDGTFTSKNTDATYVLCVLANGKVAPVYAEQKVLTFTFPVELKDGRLVDAGGDATVTIDVKRAD